MVRVIETLNMVFVGDEGCGKSSLLWRSRSENAQSELPPSLPCQERFATDLPTTRGEQTVVLIDTPSGSGHRDECEELMALAGVVVVCVSRADEAALDRVLDHWVPTVAAMFAHRSFPVVLCTTKTDLAATSKLSDEEWQKRVGEVVRQLETKYKNALGVSLAECSALEQYDEDDEEGSSSVLIAIETAHDAASEPIFPLFDIGTKKIRPECAACLQQVFAQCDEDSDGCLNDAELREFQREVFGDDIDDDDITSIHQRIHAQFPEGVVYSASNPPSSPTTIKGLNADGFVRLHEMLLVDRDSRTVWLVLRHFGFNDRLELSESVEWDPDSSSLLRPPNQDPSSRWSVSSLAGSGASQQGDPPQAPGEEDGEGDVPPVESQPGREGHSGTGGDGDDEGVKKDRPQKGQRAPRLVVARPSGTLRDLRCSVPHAASSAPSKRWSRSPVVVAAAGGLVVLGTLWLLRRARAPTQPKSGL